jgi:hypothetical protein
MQAHSVRIGQFANVDCCTLELVSQWQSVRRGGRRHFTIQPWFQYTLIGKTFQSGVVISLCDVSDSHEPIGKCHFESDHGPFLETGRNDDTLAADNDSCILVH